MSLSTTSSSSRRLTTDYVPADFSDLFGHYYDYVRRLVISRGILPQNSEDITMTILVKFFEHNALEDYDPEYRTAAGGRVAFRSFLSGFVLTYLRHHLDRQRIVAKREVVNDDIVIDRSPSKADQYEALMYADTVRTIAEHLRRGTFGSRLTVDMNQFFADVEAQISLSGRLDVNLLAADYKVSVNTIRSWLGRLRTEISEVLG